MTKVAYTADVSLKVIDESSRIQLDWEEIRHFYQFASAAYGCWCPVRLVLLRIRDRAISIRASTGDQEEKWGQ